MWELQGVNMSEKLTIQRTITSSYDHLNDEATIKLQNEIGETVQCIVYEVNTMMDKVLLSVIPSEKLNQLYEMVKAEYDSRR